MSVKRFFNKKIIDSIDFNLSNDASYLITNVKGTDVFCLYPSKPFVYYFTKEEYALKSSYYDKYIYSGTKQADFYWYKDIDIPVNIFVALCNFLDIKDIPTTTISKAMCSIINDFDVKWADKVAEERDRNRNRVHQKKRERANFYNSLVSKRFPVKEVTKYCFSTSPNYIYSSNGKECHCVKCDNRYTLKIKPRHKAIINCPKCHRESEFRRTGRNTYYSSHTPIVHVEKNNEYYIFRYFFYDEKLRVNRDSLDFSFENDLYEVARIFNKNDDLTYFERDRFNACASNDGFVESTKYYLKEWLLFNCNRDYVGNSRITPKGLKVLSSHFGKYSLFKEFMADTSELKDYLYGFKVYKNMQNSFEKFYKVGLSDLYFTVSSLNHNGNSVCDILGVSKEMYRWILENKDHLHIKNAVSILRSANSNHLKFVPHLFDHIISAIKDDTIDAEDYLFLMSSNTEAKCNYLKKNHLDVHSYQWYLKNLVKLDRLLNKILISNVSVYDICNLKSFNKSSLYPSDFHKVNDDLRNRVNEIEIESFDDTLKFVADSIYSNSSVSDIVNKSSYSLIVPSSVKEFEEEHKSMNNCLHTYPKKVSRGSCIVFFIRKKGEEDKSYYAVEINGTGIVQARTFNNSKGNDYDNVYSLSNEIWKIIKDDYFSSSRKVDNNLVVA